MHTKGNWICKKNTDGSWVVMSGDIVVAVFNRKDHPEWNEANARLIAAAPRLLAACDYAYGLLTQRDSDTDIDKAEVIEILQGIIEAAKEVQNGHE